MKDGKGVQGKGRLTDARINSFQTFYGKTIRTCKGNVDAMSQHTMAILKHYSKLPIDDRHADCPKGVDSWCKFQCDKARGDGVVTYREVAHPLSEALYDVLLPVFTALSDKKLLAGCTLGLTQNANESCHNVIWNMVPKETYHSPIEVSLGIDMSVGVFNDGQVSTMTKMFEEGGMRVSRYGYLTWKSIDQKRIKDCERKATCAYKERRQEKRHAKRKAADGFVQKEGVTYKSGHFSSEPKTRKCKTCDKPMKGHSKATCQK